MGKKLWRFIDNQATFEAKDADQIRSLYFPLCNERIISSITPDLHGDIKTGNNSFLLAPVSRIDLVSSRASRNFWVYIDKNRIWSATGVSKDISQIRQDSFKFEAGMLWQKIERENNKIGLKSEILSFVPARDYPVEIMRVTLTNISKRKIKFTPTAAIPMYCRGSHTIRDHRHVTSLLQRVTVGKFGVISKPTLLFDETGHAPNKNYFFVLGWDEKNTPPQYIYPTQDMFCGDSGDLEAPETVLKNLLPQEREIQGREPMGALRFKSIALNPKKSYSYIIVMGVTQDKDDIKKIIAGLNALVKVEILFKATCNFWSDCANQISLATCEPDFDNWFRWVSIQPTLRRIFGCSFLPDFDYGRGGRGWRDLWQDCLGLILSNPLQARTLLVNSFSGTRIDGSNATIIGRNPGEFISDRNNISRTWMDHAAWPLLTTDLYLNETGDFAFLLEEVAYFRNHELSRAQERDWKWSIQDGQALKDKTGKIYSGTILEHLLVENLVQFFNVGERNNTRLEGADWNDGLDMAKEKGESVAFTALYAHNLKLLSEIIPKIGKEHIEITKEICLLLARINYDDINEKMRILQDYFGAVKFEVSGEKTNLDVKEVCLSLREKAEWMFGHIRREEWLKEGFFNGYYDNNAQRVEGVINQRVCMTLTGQVFPVMAGIADDQQVKSVFLNVLKYLFDKKAGGFRLNTDFGKEYHQLGRAFSFVFGDKENGAFFNHMIVMFACALYKRGYVKEGWRVLSSIYKMALNTEKSKIYPCLPEYFNREARGMYSYLTGSASWFVLTMLVYVLGVRGKEGNLLIQPQLTKEQFKASSVISVSRPFAGRNMRINFHNSKKIDWPNYKIIKIFLNRKELPTQAASSFLLERQAILELASGDEHTLDIYLG